MYKKAKVLIMHIKNTLSTTTDLRKGRPSKKKSWHTNKAAPEANPHSYALLFAVSTRETFASFDPMDVKDRQYVEEPCMRC